MTPASRSAPAALVGELADLQEGVLSRRQLYAAGVTRAQVRAQLAARRWRRAGSQTIVLHTGPLPDGARRWAAVFEAGPRAFLDGDSALVAAGLTGWHESALRVSVPRGVKPRRGKGLNVRQTRRWSADDVVPVGLPRSRPDVAVVRGALWARSDKQAATLMTMSVQQRLVTPDQIAVELLRIRRDKRRAFLHAVCLDLLGGVRSIGELDFARECRRRGLPEPTRQVLRRGRGGSYYLDVLFEEWGLVVEVDGIHHAWASQIVPDALRQNDVMLQGERVLRLPLLGLRVAPDDFFAQIEAALVAAGCPLAA